MAFGIELMIAVVSMIVLIFPFGSVLLVSILEFLNTAFKNVLKRINLEKHIISSKTNDKMVAVFVMEFTIFFE